MSIDGASIEGSTLRFTLSTQLTDLGSILGLGSVGDESEYRVYAALIERNVELGGFLEGGTEVGRVFHDVMRKMFPDAAGFLVPFDGNSATVHEFPVAWEVVDTYFSIFNAEAGEFPELYVVTFVQNVETREVYQVAISRLDVSGDEVDVRTVGVPVEEREYVRVYPNPTLAGRFRVEFSSLDIIFLRVVSSGGHVVYEEGIRLGTEERAYDFSTMKEGVYHLIFYGPGDVIVSRRRLLLKRE